MKPTNRLMAEIEAGQNILIVGAPGCGKTARVKQAANNCGKKLFVVRASISERVDIAGAFVPDVEKGITKILPLEWLKEAQESKGLIFLDDLGQAPIDVQASLMMLWDELSSDGVLIWAATNRVEDQAGVYGVVSPLFTRFDAVYRIPVGNSPNSALVPELCSFDEELNGWIEWANSVDADPTIVAFHRATNGEYLYQFIPTQDPEQRCADYRTWGSLIRRFSKGLTDVKSVQACLGFKAATAFLEFLEEGKSLPNIEDVLQRPELIDSVTKTSQLFLLAELLSKNANKNLAGYVAALERIIKNEKTPFAVYSISSLVNRDPKVVVNPEIKNFFKQYGKLL